MVFSPWVKATGATANIGVSALAVGLWRLQRLAGCAVDTDQESGKTPEFGGLSFVDRVHIHFCGDGGLGFRPYGGSLGKAPSNQTLLPLTYGASLWLCMPSLRSCSVGPPPSAIHGRGRLTRHPCRVAHCAEPPLGLPRGRLPQQHREAAYRPACL